MTRLLSCSFTVQSTTPGAIVDVGATDYDTDSKVAVTYDYTPVAPVPEPSNVAIPVCMVALMMGAAKVRTSKSSGTS